MIGCRVRDCNACFICAPISSWNWARPFENPPSPKISALFSSSATTKENSSAPRSPLHDNARPRLTVFLLRSGHGWLAQLHLTRLQRIAACRTRVRSFFPEWPDKKRGTPSIPTHASKPRFNSPASPAHLGCQPTARAAPAVATGRIRGLPLGMTLLLSRSHPQIVSVDRDVPKWTRLEDVLQALRVSLEAKPNCEWCRDVTSLRERCITRFSLSAFSRLDSLRTSCYTHNFDADMPRIIVEADCVHSVRLTGISLGPAHD